ncbi:hypothetical protein ANN_05554 [Periplaneta americana]|uniref:Pre-mRNA-splicing factor CWC25 homolog n=1 Tax=Periplaneta americana TaxID=6978 RepID=A0ABQ8TCV8_PERAM|nr:hypothetical protein ANN_05554 [Periplaneta americana]
MRYLTKHHVFKSLSSDCLPSSIFSGGDEQVDMARKLQEDPLYIIKKKEIESRSQILKNPVKLKQLKELIKEEKSRKSKKHRKNKKKKRSRHDSSDDSSEDGGKDLDALLAAKYIKLKEKLHRSNIAKFRKHESDSSDDGEQKRKRGGIDKRETAYRKRKHKSDSSEGDESDSKPVKGYGLVKMSKDSSRKIKHEPASENRHRRSRSRSPVRQAVPVKKPWVRPERKKLTEEELEQKRLEMLDNAKWRDKERERNVARYKAQDEKERKQSSQYSGDFLRKQLSYAASQGTVAGRIKANINNIQRSGKEMDKNFARR